MKQGSPVVDLLKEIDARIAELREAEFKSGMHRTKEKSDYADHWARLLSQSIKALAGIQPAGNGKAG